MEPDGTSLEPSEAAVPPSFWQAVGLTFRATVRNWRTCLVLVSLYALLNGVASAISSTLAVEIDPLRATGGELVALSAATIAGFATFVIVAIFVYPPTLGALSLVGSAAVSGDVLETHGIVRRVFDRALEVIGAFVLTVLVLLAAPIVIAIVGLLAGLVVGAEAGVAAMLFLLVVLIVPAVYVFVRLCLAIPVVLREGLGPIDALRRSWELVGGAWWWVFGVTAVVVVVGSLVSGVLSAIVSFGNAGLYTFGPSGDTNIALVALGGTVAAATTGSLYGVLLGVVYSARAEVLPPAELRLPDAPST